MYLASEHNRKITSAVAGRLPSKEPMSPIMPPHSGIDLRRSRQFRKSTYDDSRNLYGLLPHLIRFGATSRGVPVLREHIPSRRASPLAPYIGRNSKLDCPITKRVRKPIDACARNALREALPKLTFPTLATCSSWSNRATCEIRSRGVFCDSHSYSRLQVHHRIDDLPQVAQDTTPCGPLFKAPLLHDKGDAYNQMYVFRKLSPRQTSDFTNLVTAVIFFAAE